MIKYLKHSGSSRQNNILVETSSHVDGALLNDIVYGVRERGCEVGVYKLQVFFKDIEKRQAEKVVAYYVY